MTKVFNRYLALLVAGMFMVCLGVLAGERYGKQKVVYHINNDDPKLQKGVLRNIQNHINAVGAENIEVRVVLHGNGLSLLLNPESLSHLAKFKYANATKEMTARIDVLKGQGVSFKICNNTIKGRKVDIVDDLYDADSADIVPSGVAELSYLQEKGFTYIKP
jgi:intracellular sulfur oxidation DsrE/DsrF family protein